MVILIDNYDSFTYNLVQLMASVGGSPIEVFRNDKIDLKTIERLNPTHIVISPGPGTPRDAGISNIVIRHFAARLPILGVCLGHQCVAEAFGGRVVQADILMHGKTDLVYHDGKKIYLGMKNPFSAARYHSLIIDEDSLPSEFDIVARSPRGEIMGIRHKTFRIEGLQFHPESFMTEDGEKIFHHFLKN